MLVYVLVPNLILPKAEEKKGSGLIFFSTSFPINTSITLVLLGQKEFHVKLVYGQVTCLGLDNKSRRWWLGDGPMNLEREINIFL